MPTDIIRNRIERKRSFFCVIETRDGDGNVLRTLDVEAVTPYVVDGAVTKVESLKLSSNTNLIPDEIKSLHKWLKSIEDGTIVVAGAGV